MAIRSVSNGTGRVRTPGTVVGTSGSAGGSGPPSNQVQALLHFDGANGGTTITDSSTYARAWLLSGSCETSTTSPKFGTACLFVNLAGSSTTRLSTADAAALSPGSQDFTIDVWLRWEGAPTNGTFAPQILSKRATSNFEFQFYTLGQAAGAVLPTFDWSVDGTNISSISGASFTPTLNTYYLLSFSKNGTSGRFFVNGVQSGSTGTVAATIFDGNAPVYVLVNVGNTFTLNGRLDDLRYVVGTGLYTSDFTPPTSAFPNP